MKIPTPKQLRELRTRLDLTQKSCADIIHKSLRIWVYFETENTKHQISLDKFELFLHKTKSQKIFEDILNNS